MASTYRIRQYAMHSLDSIIHIEKVLHIGVHATTFSYFYHFFALLKVFIF